MLSKKNNIKDYHLSYERSVDFQACKLFIIMEKIV
jgi:hypothetical protein